MFNKALFKQSCKANGTMWAIITFAVCFMLACVMLISGNGNIGEVKNAIQDTIITKEIDAQMEKRALSYYDYSLNGLSTFDSYFSSNASDNISYLTWLSLKPEQSSYNNESEYYQDLQIWKNSIPTITTECGQSYIESINTWQSSMPNISDYEEANKYQEALIEWSSSSPISSTKAIEYAYTYACEDLQNYVYTFTNNKGYTKDSTETQEVLGSIMYTLNPNGLFNDFYEQYNEIIPADYDIMSIINHISSNDINDYLSSEERIEYRQNRSSYTSPIFLAGNMSKEENIEQLTSALSSYGVTKEKFDTFGYTYDSIKHMANTAVITYQGRVNYELSLIKEEDYENHDEYLLASEKVKEDLAQDISSSFLSTLPEMVSEALEEVGKADLYMLIVGSIFYKLAGLLLPIIYMIMASNNLIAGQVDSGSMAYVLSTSTKRKDIVFTQAVYLVGSLFAMFTLTTITGSICLTLITEEVGLTFGKLLLLNLGAFLVLFTLSGLCFFTSCYFDRSKHSMAIGGGLSIFALVAAMLGLFGSSVIPSVVRLDTLNYFNYVSIISLFDVISIIDGTATFVWKFSILLILGLIGYILGSIKFTKKDLPL